MKRVKFSQAIGVLFVMMVASNSTWAAYDVGFTWNRWDDWKPGTINNSSVGNPCTDSAGNPAWSYEYYAGVSLGSDLGTANPWYELPSSGSMVWYDPPSYIGVWGYQYEVPPFVFPGPNGLRHYPKNQVHNGDHFAQVPLVRWDNPSSDPITVSLTSGDGFRGVINPLPTGTVVDIVIARTDASDGDSVHLLYSETITKTMSESAIQYLDIPALNIEDLGLDPGDDILFSVRSRNMTLGGGWYSVGLDDDVTITVVPEPATMSLLALGGLAMLRRRRLKVA